MTKDEALKQALEALEKHAELGLLAGATITAIKEVLAQPEREPVAYTGNGTAGREVDVKPTGFFFQMPQQKPVAHTLNCVCGAVWDIKADWSEEMVHTPDTTPPQREWVGLTDEDKAELDEKYGDDTLAHLDAVEAKLKEKNT